MALLGSKISNAPQNDSLQFKGETEGKLLEGERKLGSGDWITG